MLYLTLLLALAGVSGSLAGGPEAQRILWAPETFAYAVAVDAPHAAALSAADDLLGVPYHYAGLGPDHCPTGEHPVCADCSGLVFLACAAAGMKVPRISSELAGAGESVPREAVLPGDILIFRNDGSSAGQPNHVGLYVGNGLFIHAGTRGVRLDDLDGPYWGNPRRPRLRDIRRIAKQ